MRPWLKKSLIGSVLLLLVSTGAGMFWLSTTESGLRWAYQQAAGYIPGELNIGKLEGRLLGPITATNIAYRQADTRVDIGRATLQWQPLALLTGRIVISQLHVETVNVNLPEAAQAEPDQAVVLPDIQLPWRIALKDIRVDDINILRGEQQFDVQYVTLKASSVLSKIDIGAFSVMAKDFDLQLDGRLNPTGKYPHNLNMRWHVRLPDQPEFTGQGQSRGNLDKLTLQQTISGPLQMNIEAEARNLLNQLDWQASMDVSEINTAQLNADWPAVTGSLQLQGKGNRQTASLSGQMDGEYPGQGPFSGNVELQLTDDGTLALERLRLQSPGTNSVLNARGNWTPGDAGIQSGNLALKLDWENLRWPLKGDAWVDSATGHGQIDGNPDHYRLTLSADRPLPQAPPSTWHVNATGDLVGLDLDSLRITALDGETTLAGRLDWSPRLAWDMRVTGNNLNPAEQWPQWPGRLSAGFTSTGYIQAGQITAQADITRISGELRGQPVNLHGRLVWDAGQLNLEQFELESGSAKVSAQGFLGDRLSLNWTIDAPDLAMLYPQADGQLQATGKLGGTQDEPIIQASFDGKVISLPGYQIGNLSGKLDVDLFRWQQINIDLVVEAIRVHNQRIDRLEINAEPGQLQLVAMDNGNTARVQLDGAASSDGWRGQITSVELLSKELDNWQLQQPVDLNLVKNNLELAPFCLQSSEARVCGEVEQTGQNWRSQLELVNFPLQIFSPWLPAGMVIDGVANATAAWKLDSPKKLTGRANIELPAGSIVYPLLEGELDRWEYRSGSIDLTVNDEGLRASSKLDMQNKDQFQASLSLPGAQLLNLDNATQTLQGSARLTINDLGIIEALLPDVQDLDGKLAISLDAGGTLAKPHYTGQANLSQGQLRIPRLGLQLEQIRMNAHSDGLNKLNYELQAHSGEGDLRLQGQTTLDNQAGWPTTMSLKGEAFEVARIPEARVNISPDLRLKLQGRRIDISGKVHVPFADLQPKDVTSAARVSQDVVIIGGEEVIEEKWQITTRVRLTLGDRVSVYGFGFEGRLGGDLLLMDSPGELTTATGEINVIEGRYNAYGQRLTVEHGRLLYTGGPVSNPGLDLRAVRKVNNVTAGIRVRGSLNQPDIELFSIPAMGQTDVLAYLMLGRPLETASGEEGSMMARAALALSLSTGDSLARQIGDRFGLDEMRVEASDSGEQASLVMGRYLAPKLYVSYGVGIVESFNTLSVRYQLSDHWYIKGESGEHQSADILYTIDR